MCECRKTINAGLAEHGGQLASAFSGLAMKFHPYLVETERLDPHKRGRRIPIVLASFCPFCGERVLLESGKDMTNADR